MFAELFNKLYCIEQISDKTKFAETWVNISFSGIYNSQNKSYFDEVYSELANIELANSIHFSIENTEKSLQDFKDELQNNDNWKISINKNISQNKETSYNFFYSQNKLIEWIKGTNPFAEDYPLNNKPFRIIVNGLDDNFGGFNFIVCNQNYENLNFVNSDWNDFDEVLIANNIHNISNTKLIINPLKHFLSYGKTTEISKYFYKNSILVLLASLSNDITPDDSIILRGFRKIEIKLGRDYLGTEMSVEYQEKLANAVKWIYQKCEKERCDLKLKLLLERITLDIDYNLSYSQGLFSVIEEATNQARERYNFITYDRKDLYQKELKDLLKDLKTLSELYSNKLRSLLSNLLRDVLAAFILVGITLFSKTNEISKLIENKLIKYVFVAFGFYFILSAVFQIVTDIFDVVRSNKEFDYWKNISREYMPQKDFENHKSKTLTKRANGTMIIYAVVFLFYIAIAFVCFYFPCIWSKIIN
jgi:hypothetical protein